MSLVPGAAGSPSVHANGVQTDHIYENTTNHGTRVKGVADPTTYPILAGDVGEKLTASLSNTTISVSNTDTVVGTLTLTAGIWMVYAKMYMAVPGSSVSSAGLSISSTTATHTDSSVRDTSTSIAADKQLAACPRYFSTSGGTIYMVANCGFTGTAPYLIGAGSTFYAVRIA